MTDSQLPRLITRSFFSSNVRVNNLPRLLLLPIIIRLHNKTEHNVSKQYTLYTFLYSSLFTITVVQYNIKNTLTNKLKPPSHQPRSHYVLQKLGGRSKNFVQRSMNAVETDKDVIWSP